MDNSALIARDDLIPPGGPAPDFTLLDQNGQKWRLSGALKEGPVVLCFFPVALNNSCALEMRCLSDEIATLPGSKARVVGISCDVIPLQRASASAETVSQTLLVDADRTVCRAYGLHSATLNMSWRGTVVIEAGPGGQGRVKWARRRSTTEEMKFDSVLVALS